VVDIGSEVNVDESSEQTAGGKGKRLIGGIRARVLLLIFIPQALMIWWVADSEISRGIYLICYSLMMPTVLYLLFARVLRRWLPFDDKELLIGYIVLTATIPIVGFGGLRFLMTGMGYLPFFAKTQPQWVRYLPFVHSLPVLQNMDAISDLYRGGHSVSWKAWIIPIGFWSTYLILLSGIWVCLAGILRRVWISQERLTFPIAMLPLQVMNPKEDIFRRPVFWIGFAIPVVMQSLLVLNQWYPAVPAMQLKAYNIAPILFTTPPWNAIPDFQVGFYPMAIGLAFFVPSDVSLSCWLLAVLMKLSYVVAGIFGVEAAGTGAARFPFREEQAAGSWVAFACIIIWGARHHWRTVYQLVSASERGAVRKMAFIAGLFTVVCIGMMAVTGIPVIAAAVVILVYIAYVLSGARVRAEAGALWTFAPLGWTPHRTMTSVMGAQGLGDQALVSGGYFNLIHWDIRGQSLPYLMEGLDIAENSGIKWRTVLTWVTIGTVTAIALGWWAGISKLYLIGAATAKANPYPLTKAQINFNEIDRVATGARAWDPAGIGAFLFAAGLTVLLTFTRRFGILGLHPVGYVLSNTLIMNAFIVPFFLAWLAKTLILRFGGHKAYRGTVPIFVGVILGDVVIQAVWALVGGVTGLPIYQFLT